MSHSEAWPPPHHRVLPALLWSGNRGLRMGRDSRHVLEYNICQWCELLALKVLIAERFLK